MRLRLKWNMTFSRMSRKECGCSFLLRIVPSSFCMKKLSFLLPFSLSACSICLVLYVQCLLESLGVSPNHPKVIKNFCLINVLSQIVGHLQGKMKARPLLNIEAAKDALAGQNIALLCVFSSQAR